MGLQIILVNSVRFSDEIMKFYPEHCIKYRQSRPAQIHKHHTVQSFGGRKKLTDIVNFLIQEGILKQD